MYLRIKLPSSYTTCVTDRSCPCEMQTLSLEQFALCFAYDSCLDELQSLFCLRYCLCSDDDISKKDDTRAQPPPCVQVSQQAGNRVTAYLQASEMVDGEILVGD